MEFDPKATIVRRKRGERVKAILKVKDWFNERYIAEIYKDFYVVCTWSELTDGVKWYYEARTTIAVCQRLEDARAVFSRKQPRKT